MTGLAPLPGSPAGIRIVADRLEATSARLGALARVLARLRHGVTWEGPAGDALGARLADVAPLLDAVAARLGGAVAPLRALAHAMEEAQAVIDVAIRSEREAEHAYLALEDRAYALVATGATEDDPALLVLRHLQREQVRARASAQADHRAAADRFREADARCARVLRALVVDEVADPATYRVLAGASSVGHDLASAGVLSAVAPQLRPLAAAGEAVGMSADAALLVAYDEGDVATWGSAVALSATGGAGAALRRGAVAGAEHTARGAVRTRHLTTAQRLALGVAHEARARRDAVRAALADSPGRGTPSALTGGPVVRAPGVAPGGATGLLPRARDVARAGAARARAATTAGLDRAFRDDWRLATANGPAAQQLYVGGASLQLAAGAAGAASSTVTSTVGGRGTAPTAATTPTAEAGKTSR